MRSVRTVVALAALALLPATGTGRAAEATADWPCIQPRQPHLSLGQMWVGPPPGPQAEALARSDAAIASLAEALALRRVPITQAQGMIAQFAGPQPSADRLGGLMLAVLARVDRQRSAILDGIARYGTGQSALARHIAERRGSLDAMGAAPAPDFDRIDTEEERLEWDQRIFEERRQMLSAVCESPVLMEQRLFEIARAIAAHLPQDGAAGTQSGAAPTPDASPGASPGASPAAAPGQVAGQGQTAGQGPNPGQPPAQPGAPTPTPAP